MFDNFVFRNIPRNIEGVSHLSCVPNREYPHIPAVSRIPHCKFPHIPVVWRFHFVFMMSKQLISCVDCWFRMRERFLAERSRKNAFGDPFSPSKAPFFCSTRNILVIFSRIFWEYRGSPREYGRENMMSLQEEYLRNAKACVLVFRALS